MIRWFVLLIDWNILAEEIVSEMMQADTLKSRSVVQSTTTMASS